MNHLCKYQPCTVARLPEVPIHTLKTKAAVSPKRTPVFLRFLKGVLSNVHSLYKVHVGIAMGEGNKMWKAFHEPYLHLVQEVASPKRM